MTSYESRLVRREVVGGKDKPEEEVVFRLRKEPFSVYMRNTGDVGKGREVLYYPAKHKDLMHVVVGAGDSMFMSAGRKAPSMSPDSPMVRDKSRQTIRDAGFGRSVAAFNALADRVAAGRTPAANLKFAGAQVRKDMPGATLESVEQTILPGDEPLLPKGGRRQWFFDSKPESPSYGLPVLIVTHEGAREVEYYRFDRFRLPAGLTDADFDPEKLGKK